MTDEERLPRVIEDALLDAERRIRLLERVRPVRFRDAVAHFRQQFERGTPARLGFAYEAPPDFSELRAALERIARHAAEAVGGPVAALLEARARELDLEARLVEYQGHSTFRELARQRFVVDEEDQREAEAWSARELEYVAPPAEPATIDLESLFGAHPFLRDHGVRVRAVDMAADVAVASDVVFVRRGARVTVREGARLLLHEIEGHLAPRVRARNEPPPFRVGTARSGEDEEGRALVLEARAGHFDGARRREIAFRFLAASSARRGADEIETARALLERGLDAEGASRLVGRVFRGGGLAREIVYATAFLRVGRGFAAQPAVEAYFERGRVSLEAAQTLSELGS